MPEYFHKTLVEGEAVVGKTETQKGDRRSKTQIVIEGLRKCREITKHYGTSFFFATQFFPNDIKQGIYGVYAFARIPDEIVDDPKNKNRADTILRLEDWRRSWLHAMQKGESDNPVMAAIVFTFSKFNIPVEDGDAFLNSMFMDLEKSSYSTYRELEQYMYGSAGVIGLMVTRIVGFSSDAAFPYAKKLGYAFQLTNFLRDIKEDSQDLKRIYLPSDELANFNLSADEIKAQIYDERFVKFMKFQISRNRKIYREALPGIDLLKWRGRLAVRISYVLYKAILTEIERVDYDVFRGRVRTNFRQKVWLSLRALVGIYD